MSRRRLQAILMSIGTVATVAGAGSMIGGTASVLRGERSAANVDSEFRFYAAWHAVLGVLVLRAARRPEEETVIIRACGGGFLLAACSRGLSWLSVGKPHPLFRALMAVEIAIPAVIVPWQNSLAAKRAE